MLVDIVALSKKLCTMPIKVSKMRNAKLEIIKNDFNTIGRLVEVEEKVSASSMPLRTTTLNTVKSLWEAFDGTRPATARDIQNAVFIDSASDGYPVVKSLINRGAICRKQDLEIIESFDKQAAEFLSKRFPR